MSKASFGIPLEISGIGWDTIQMNLLAMLPKGSAKLPSAKFTGEITNTHICMINVSKRHYSFQHIYASLTTNNSKINDSPSEITESVLNFALC